jgi:uncharacterized protein (TIGR03435 family)
VLEHSGDDGSGNNAACGADDSKPAIFTALQERLGLRMEATKGLVEMIVIDRVEQPSGN